MNKEQLEVIEALCDWTNLETVRVLLFTDLQTRNYKDKNNGSYTWVYRGNKVLGVFNPITGNFILSLSIFDKLVNDYDNVDAITTFFRIQLTGIVPLTWVVPMRAEGDYTADIKAYGKDLQLWEV